MADNALIVARRRIWVALDVPTLDAALRVVDEVGAFVGGFKVGLEVCSAVGVPQVVAAIHAVGGAVFLDLKFKDIPNTVAGAVQAVRTTCGAAVHMLTLHCDGGSAMLQAAARAVAQVPAPRPLLLGVTVLTSMDNTTLDELGVVGGVEAQVVRLALLAHHAGINGVVASPQEVAAIKHACGASFLTVTPGVRPTWAHSDDQRRVMSPAEACRAGADYLVIGRPITAATPAQGGMRGAARRIAEEIAQANDTVSTIE